MPSREHDVLADKALIWLANRATHTGIRGAREIQIANGYVADACAIGWLQYHWYRDYLDRSELHKKRFRPIRHPSPGDLPWIAPKDYNVADEIDRDWCYLFESKISRADFWSTFNHSDKHANRREPMANLHWIVTPCGMIQQQEVPDFWGLLEVSGGGLKETKKPILQIVPELLMLKYAKCILWKGCWNRRDPECGVWIDEEPDYQI